MKSFVVLIGVLIIGSSLSANDMSSKESKLYVDGKKSIKRELTLEDRKKLLKSKKPLNRENVHKTKSYLGKK